jgi:hypothetical protein
VKTLILGIGSILLVALLACLGWHLAGLIRWVVT